MLLPAEKGGGCGRAHALEFCHLDPRSQDFMESYGALYPMYTGAMAKGIASAELVIAAGKARCSPPLARAVRCLRTPRRRWCRVMAALLCSFWPRTRTTR